jgi:hypothetical protein
MGCWWNCVRKGFKVACWLTINATIIILPKKMLQPFEEKPEGYFYTDVLLYAFLQNWQKNRPHFTAFVPSFQLRPI